MQPIPVVRHSPVASPSAVREGQNNGDFAALLSQQMAVGGTSAQQGSASLARGADSQSAASQTAGRLSSGATALTSQEGLQSRLSKETKANDSTTASSAQTPDTKGQPLASKAVSAPAPTGQGSLGSSVQSASVAAGHDSSAALSPAMAGGNGAPSAGQYSESWMTLLSAGKTSSTGPELPLVKAATTAPAKKPSAPTLSGSASAGLWAMAAQINPAATVGPKNGQTAVSESLLHTNGGAATAIMASLTPALSSAVNGQTPVVNQGQSPPLFPDLAATSLPPATLGASIPAIMVSAPTLASVGSGHRAPADQTQGINPLSPSLLSSQPSAAASLALATPVSSAAAWGGELAQTVTWMIGHHQSTAALQLNPPDLGPMTVVVQVVGNQANAFFSSPHAQVRDAIQQALPQLSEQMASHGLMLGQTNVSDQQAGSSQGGWAAMAENRQSLSLKAGSEVSSGLSVARSAHVVTRLGLIDTFA